MYSNIARKKVSYRGLSFVLRENTHSIYRTKIHRRKENEKIFCNVQIKQNGGAFMRIVTYDLEKDENDEDPSARILPAKEYYKTECFFLDSVKFSFIRNLSFNSL